MVTDRFIEPSDLIPLAISLAKDQYHKGTEAEFFTQFGCISKVYEDEVGPIMYVRGAKALRLDIQFTDNNDARRNMKAMLERFPDLVEKAKDNGFAEIVFVTNSPLLKKFCEKRLGFEILAGDELRRII